MGEIVTNHPQMLAGNQRVLMDVGRVDAHNQSTFLCSHAKLDPSCCV